jgi:hypothetical protein
MRVEFVFVAILAVFAVTGMARGYKQEMGVTILLLLALGGVGLIESNYSAQLSALLARTIDHGALYDVAARGVLNCVLLLLALFAAYQAHFLRFPGPSPSNALSFSNGLLNGYLLGGSLWFYLAQGGWPLVPLSTATLTPIDRILLRELPPSVYPWPVLLAMALFFLLARLLSGQQVS